MGKPNSFKTEGLTREDWNRIIKVYENRAVIIPNTGKIKNSGISEKVMPIKSA